MLRFKDGSSYSGEFQENNLHGHGKYIWKDNKIYIGDWKQNKMNGKGILTWTDGRTYSGYFLNDKRHGKGVFSWNHDGKKIFGTWKDGSLEGIALVTENGEEIIGEWANGERIKWLDHTEIILNEDVIKALRQLK